MSKIGLFMLILVLLFVASAPVADAHDPAPKPPHVQTVGSDTQGCLWARNRVTHRWIYLCPPPPIEPLPRDVCDGCVGG